MAGDGGSGGAPPPPGPLRRRRHRRLRHARPTWRRRCCWTARSIRSRCWATSPIRTAARRFQPTASIPPGAATGAHPPGARQPRVPDPGRRRLFRLLRRRRPAIRPRGTTATTSGPGTWSRSTATAPVGGCAAGIAQEQWLRQDLAANPRACTLAYWHHPRFSSGGHGNTTAMDPLWQSPDGRHAELVLNGHDHGYQRCRPLNASGGAIGDRHTRVRRRHRGHAA